MTDWKEALERLQIFTDPNAAVTDATVIRAHIEGLEASIRSLSPLNYEERCRLRDAEARVQELEIELDARINQQVSAGTREKLVSARDKLDGDEWRAICGMFIEADNVARGCQEYAREVEDKLRRFLDITEGYMKSKSGGDEERWYEEFYALRPG